MILYYNGTDGIRHCDGQLKMLTIIEEIFLLALDDTKGQIPNSIAIPLRFTMSAAILTELFLSGRIKMDPDMKVVLGDETPCGNPLIDEALDILKAVLTHPKSMPSLLEEINPRPKELLKRVGSGLVRQGVLQFAEKKFLWVFPYLVFLQHDPSIKYWLKQHLRGVVLAGEVADLHSLMVLNLLQVGHMLDFAFTRDEIRTARERIPQMIGEALVNREAIGLVSEIETSVINLVATAFFY